MCGTAKNRERNWNNETQRMCVPDQRHLLAAALTTTTVTHDRVCKWALTQFAHAMKNKTCRKQSNTMSNQFGWQAGRPLNSSPLSRKWNLAKVSSLSTIDDELRERKRDERGLPDWLLTMAGLNVAPVTWRGQSLIESCNGKKKRLVSFRRQGGFPGEAPARSKIRLSKLSDWGVSSPDTSCWCSCRICRRSCSRTLHSLQWKK